MVYTWYYDKDSLILDKMPVPVPLLPRRPWLMHRSFFYNGRANLPAWLCGHGKRPISLSHTGRSGWPCGPFWRAFRPVLQCAGTQAIAQCGPWHDFFITSFGPGRRLPLSAAWLPPLPASVNLAAPLCPYVHAGCHPCFATLAGVAAAHWPCRCSLRLLQGLRQP